ncbi:MAG: DUF58 domain-containing protein [Planctomycetaceae bacterium]
MVRDQADPNSGSVSLFNLMATVCGVVMLFCVIGYSQVGGRLMGIEWFLLVLVATSSTLFGLRQVILRKLVPGRRVGLGFRSRHQVMLPRPGMVYLVMMLTMALGSLLGHSNMLMMMFSMMAGPFVINGWIVYSMLKKTRLQRRIPARVMAGEVLSVNIVLNNDKNTLSSRLISVQDQLHGRDEQLTASVMFVRVPPRGMRTGSYQVRLSRRGYYEFGPMFLSSSFPLGLGQRGVVIGDFEKLLVVPRVGKLTHSWVRDQQDAAMLVQRQRSRQGTFDDEFHRMREYRSGDNPRRIHWRTSARQNELIVKEFHQDREFDLNVVLDLWQPNSATSEHLERVELAVSFCATVCIHHLQNCRDSNLNVILGSAADSALQLDPGSLAREAVLERLALLEADSTLSLDDLLEQWFIARAQRSRSVLISTRAEAVHEGMAAHTGIARDALHELHVVEADWKTLRDLFTL